MEKENLKANDLFAKDTEKDAEILKKAEKAPMIPSGYIPVKLSSLGKLGFPSIVHVRDYHFDEAIQMGEITEENVTEVLVNIVNSVIYEDVDIKKAHRQDLLEILITIYGTWYSPTLENFKYYVNLDLPKEEKEKKENISVATIPISNINTTPLNEKAKIPIKLSKKDFEVGLILPKVENEIIASKFLEEKYAEEENKLQNIIKKSKEDRANPQERKQYEEFLNRKGKDFLKIAQALLIDSFNGKKLENVKDKLNAINEIPLNVWAVYNREIKEKFHFGVEQEVTFQCSVIQKEIIRRFQFREIHFLPSLVEKDDSGFTISFG